MAQGKPVGTAYAEISLDSTKLEQGLKRTHDALISGSIKVEDAYKHLGIKSDQVYNQMRTNATAAVDFIKNKTLSSKEEIIRAEQAAANKIKALNEQQFGAQTSLINNLKKHWLATIAAIYAAQMILTIAWNLAEQAAQFEEMKRGLGGLAAQYNMTADAAIKMAKEAVSGQLSMVEAGKLAARAFALALNPEQIKTFLIQAEKLTDTVGGTIPEAFEAMERAAATGRAKGLVQYGIVVDLNKVLEDYATKHNIAKDSISAHTAMQIRAIAIMEESKRVTDLMGESIDSTADKMERLKATVQDLQLHLGTVLIRAALGAVGAFQWLSASFLTLSAAFWTLIRPFEWILEKMGLIEGGIAKAAAVEAWRLAQEMAGKAADNLKAMVASSEDLANAKGSSKMAEDMEGISETAENLADEFEGLRTKLEQEIKVFWLDDFDKDLENLKTDFEEWKKDLGLDKARILFSLSFKIIGLKQTEREIKEFYTLMEEYQNDLEADESKTIIDLTKTETAYNNLLASIDPVINRQLQEAAAIKTINDALELHVITADEASAAIKKLGEYYAILDLGNIVGDPAAEANFYSQISGYEAQYRETLFEAIDAQAEKYTELYDDEVASAKWARDEKIKFDEEVAKQKIENIAESMSLNADAFEQLSQLYAKDSAERKILHDISMAFNVAEKAALAVQAVRAAVVAIATQGQGDPYTAFVRIATMTAAMATLLASIGLAFSSSGTTTSTTSTLPASTVLGAEAGTGSESAQKSLEILEETYSMEYHELHNIYEAMKDLNNNITGLVTSIVRTGGVTSWTSTLPTSHLGAIEDFVLDVYDLIDIGDILNTITFGIYDWMAGIVGDIWGWIFGGDVEVEIEEAGIQFGQMLVKDLLAGIDMAGQQYADIKETTSGWFGSEDVDYYTLYEALDENVNTLFTSIFKSLSITLITLAKAFGTDTQAVLDYMFPEIKIDLQGLSTEEINDVINEFISNAADTVVETLFGDIIKGYQQIDEGLLETAIRLVTDMEVIQYVLEETNQSFAGTIPEIIAFSEALIEMAGSLDDLTEAAETYYDKFFTDTEKEIRLQKQLSDVLEDINLTLPSTREGYRDLIEGLDLTTEAGQEAYVTLLKLAESADAYYSYLEDLVENIVDTISNAVDFVITMQSKIDDITGSTQAMDMMWDRIVALYYQTQDVDRFTAAERFTKLQEYIDYLDEWYDANIAAIEDFYTIQTEAIQSQIDNANDLIDVLNDQKDAIDDQISAIQEQIDLTAEWKTVLDSINDQILDMETSLTSPADIFERMDVMWSEMERIRGLYEGSTGTEQTGYASDLQDLISEYLGMAEEAYQRPSPEYQAIYSKLYGWLEAIKVDAEAGSASETDLLAQIADLQNQQTAIDKQIAAYNEEIAAYNEEIAALNTQMAADIQSFKDEAAGYYQWAMDEGIKLYAEQISELEQTLKDVVGDNTVGGYIENLRDEIVWELKRIQELLSVPGMTIPSGQGGISYVPYDNYIARLHHGERVLTAQENRRYRETTITIAPNITINATGDASPREIGKEVEKVLISSIKYGKARKVIQEMVRT